MVLALIGAPAALAVAEAARFYVVNRHNGLLLSSGERREYLLHVPASYDGTRPVPLVISLHGGALWGGAQRDISQWNAVADREGVIVVYPSGSRSGGPRAWHVGEGGPPRDVRFIADLIDTLQARYNVDSARIYANGLSNGGGMSFALSCTLGDRIAAVGMVGAAHLLPWDWCPDQRAVPMIAFHGTADRQALYRGGWTWLVRFRLPDIPTWTARWARRNGCGEGPVDSAVAADVTRRSYPGCTSDAAVVLYTVHGGGHSWPGSKPSTEWFVGRTTRSIDATSLMWEFFRAHPLN